VDIVVIQISIKAVSTFTCGPCRAPVRLRFYRTNTSADIRMSGRLHSPGPNRAVPLHAQVADNGYSGCSYVIRAHFLSTTDTRSFAIRTLTVGISRDAHFLLTGRPPAAAHRVDTKWTQAPSGRGQVPDSVKQEINSRHHPSWGRRIFFCLNSMY
jgi:hypothetical protein